MSESPLDWVDPVDEMSEHRPKPGRRRAERKRGRGRLSGCLLAVLLVALLGGGLYYVVDKGASAIDGMFGGPEDYAGPGKGEVLFDVKKGDTAAEIGRNLKSAGVVASVEAFTTEANTEPLASQIQVGTYPMKEKMSARGALDVLINPKSIVRGDAVTVREGLTAEQILEVLAEETDVKLRKFKRALKSDDLGLPRYADGAEGYLFPATYTFGEDATAVEILSAMVDRWEQAADTVGLTEGAKRLGITPAEAMTVASLVEAEGRGDDMPKISRVIYNRLEDTDGETRGLLQIDATVNYAVGKDDGNDATTTSEERESDSPYNTYRFKGLPPGPIESPGEDAMTAAVQPADGDWLFYVTVNLATGETKFAETSAEHEENREEYFEYCRNESERC